MSSMLEKVGIAWKRAWGEGDTQAFQDIVADGYVRHSKTGEEGIEDVIEQIKSSHRAFSDFRVEILQALEDSEAIAILWESTGIHTGEFMGVPPTGRKVVVRGAAFIRHADGQILEESTVWDPRDLLASMKIVHLGNKR